MAIFNFLRRFFKSGSPPERAEILFFGLGNKSRRYEHTRHNIGFRIAEEVARRLDNSSKGFYAEAEYTFGTLFESRKKVVAVKPHTFMNRSGDAVKRYIETCRSPLSNLLVIVDDYYLPLGKTRIRGNGSDGGHNGLKSIISRIGSENFPRFRIGIGPLPEGVSSAGFVLGYFTRDEERVLEEVIQRAVDACLLFAQDGIDPVMNKYNS